jgi:hypothetical protein
MRLEEGRAYLFLAKSLPKPGTVSAASANTIFIGDTERGAAGRCVAGGRDVNGDGLPDIVIGAPMFADYQDLGTGKAHLLLTP